MVSQTETERDVIVRLLEEERSRTNGLEGLLASSRTNEAAAADQIRNLARENAQLFMKLNEARARLEKPEGIRKDANKCSHPDEKP